MGKKERYSTAELEELFKLVDWCIDGPEHGVMTTSQWENKLKQLLTMIQQRGYDCHGQWTMRAR